MNEQAVQIGQRTSLVIRGRRLEYFTIAYNSLEGLIALVAGLMAGRIALVGFGFDSLIEATSGSVLLWRLHADVDEERRERIESITLRIVGACIVFTSERIENIPVGFRARETYKILGPDEFTEVFEVAEPGKDFEDYSEGHFKRKE